ncbi:MAG: insulinase family protein [Elusimicrobia bacterium]|nr:insulinase family protein [Elusimicrobiota bacterium]
MPRIKTESYSLPNGMRVVLAPDRTVPVATVSMIVNVGSRSERPGRSGFAHLFEHLMFEGSQNVPRGMFDKLLESYGGDNNASTHKDFTHYYENVPSNALPVALWLDADRLNALAITDEARENQISVVKEEKRLRIDNEPYGPALYDEISARSYKNWQNAHSTMGSFEELEAASREDVQEFFNANYAPSNVILGVVGDFEPEEIKPRIETLFGRIPNRGKPAPVDTREPDGAFTFVKGSISDAHANLPAAGIAWRGMPERGTRDFYALSLLGSVLFGGKSSRLYLRLVKDSQTAISVDGGLGFPETDYSEFKAPGIFGAFVVYKSGRTAEDILRLMEAGIGEIAADGVGDAELARIKTKFRSDWIRSQETALGRAGMILRAALLDGDAKAADADLERYLACTSADIRAAAAKYLTRERAMLLEILPEASE